MLFNIVAHYCWSIIPCASQILYSYKTRQTIQANLHNVFSMKLVRIPILCFRTIRVSAYVFVINIIIILSAQIFFILKSRNTSYVQHYMLNSKLLKNKNIKCNIEFSEKCCYKKFANRVIRFTGIYWRRQWFLIMSCIFN